MTLLRRLAALPGATALAALLIAPAAMASAAAAASGRAADPPAQVAQPTPAPSPVATAPAATPDPLAGPMQAVAQARGLAWKSAVKSRHVTIAEAIAELKKLLEEEFERRDVAAQERLLVQLGLLPEGYDLRGKVGSLLAEQVAGFYNPRNKTFYLVDFPPDHPQADMLAIPGAQDLILAHELDHALNDQHFDLTQLLDGPAVRDHDDVALARHCLGEGDATLVMLLVTLQQMTGALPTPQSFPAEEELDKLSAAMDSTSQPELANAPPYVKDQLLQPYLLGLQLVVRAWRQGGWPAVDALWKKPPQSTEQILHPERADDPPSPPRAPVLAAGWKILTSLELGELGLRTWLTTRFGKDRAAVVAEGWDGDRVYLVQDPEGKEHVYLATVWDFQGQAAEFRTTLQRWPENPAKTPAGLGVPRLAYSDSEVFVGFGFDPALLLGKPSGPGTRPAEPAPPVR